MLDVALFSNSSQELKSEPHNLFKLAMSLSSDLK